MRRSDILKKLVCAVVLLSFVLGCTRTVLTVQPDDYTKIKMKESKFISASAALDTINKKIALTELKKNDWEIEQRYAEREVIFEKGKYFFLAGTWPIMAPLASPYLFIGVTKGCFLCKESMSLWLYHATYPISSLLFLDLSGDKFANLSPYRENARNTVSKVEFRTLTEHSPMKEGGIVVYVSNGKKNAEMGVTDSEGQVSVRPEVLNSLCRESPESCRLSLSYQRQEKGDKINAGEVTVGSDLILWAKKNNPSYREKEEELFVLMKKGALERVVEFLSELKKDPFYEPIVREGDSFVSRTSELKKIVFDGTKTSKSHPRSSRPFEAIQDLTQKMVEDYLNLSQQIPPEIRKPELPPPPKLVKSEFETKTMFEEKVNQALEERQKEIVKLQEKYRRNVEERNQKIEKLEEELESRKREVPIRIVEFIHEAFYAVMGKPILTNPVFDAETGTMYVDFKASNSEYQKRVAIKIPLSEAELFKSKLNNVRPKAIFEIQKGEVVLKEISIKLLSKNYVAVLTDQDFKPEKMEVALQDKKIDFSSEKLNLQNPNLIDTYQVSAISYGESSGVSGRKYNDDLTPLISKCVQKEIDPRKWLFIVAVENYDEADKVVFAKNSAEAFEKTAQRVFGVDNRHTSSLIDANATSGKIKNKLSFLLNNVKEGDTIYFYYSGHGVPAPPSNEAYILPKDMVVDFISREEDFNLSNIYRQLSDSKALKIFAFVDACFSGKTDNQIIFKGVAPGLMRTKKVRFDDRKMVVITAGKDTQFSNSFDEKGHRMFSYYLIKSLLTREHPDLDTVYKEVSVKVKDSSWAKGDVYLQEPQIDGNRELGL